MKHDLSAGDYLRKLYPEESQIKGLSRDVTFQLGEDCSLRCTYCYQGCKSKKAMTWEVAKKCVDLLYRMWDEDDKTAFINKDTRQIILDFIGGEPLLYIDLMEKIVEYFVDCAIDRRSVWAETYMISMASNGTRYFEDKIQNFFDKYKNHLSFSVSIDGPKEMHDACRVFPDGSGSFDIAKKAQDDFNSRFYHTAGTKATIARANLPYLGELIDFYVKQGYTQIHANYVYEEEWNIDDAKLLYKEMKELADYIINLNHEVEVSLFEEIFFHPKAEDDLQCWCGGTGEMLAFDPDGLAYPCVRYMRSSLGDDQPPIVIGDCENGLYYNDEYKAVEKELNEVDRRTQSTDECFHCDIAAGCSDCAAWNYQMYGTVKSRCTNICIMHKARSLANSYYWNKLYAQNGSNLYFHRWLSDEEALKIISKEELDMLDNQENILKSKNAKMVNGVV